MTMPAIRAVIIGHGNLARALLDAAERILGKQRQVEIISNAGISGDALCARIARTCNQTRRDMIVFVDLPGGSCTISCMKTLRAKKRVWVVTGMNLPMMLEFFLLRSKFKAGDLVPILIKKARHNIMQVPGSGGSAH